MTNTPERPTGGDPAAPTLPRAELAPERRLSVAWIVPVLALLLAVWLAYSAWEQRGTIITVQFREGHGLKIGDQVRFRGMVVGEVRDVTLAGDIGHVVVEIAIHAQPGLLTRAGTRFWIVRPQLGLTGVGGLETLVGSRYMAVLPGPPEGRPRRTFVGLDDPPVVATVEPEDLEIVLEAPRRGSLQPGSPVTYRQIRIGTVRSVGLASDGSGVEARVHIQKAYRELVRRRTRFWDAGGLEASLGLGGLNVELGSLEEVLIGGVALATPTPERAGETVRTGHRFTLYDAPDPEWLGWEPVVAIGSSLLPAGAALPDPLRVHIAWRKGGLFKGGESRRGWVLQTAEGLLGPIDLLRPADNADQSTVVFEVAGQSVRPEAALIWEDNGLGLLEVMVHEPVWPAARRRVAQTPEDCIVVGDPTAAPLPLAAARLRSESTRWRVDAAVSVDETWHGACVVSREDGALVGVLLVDGDDVTVALLRPRATTRGSEGGPAPRPRHEPAILPG